MALAVRRGPVKHPRRRQQAVGRSRQFEWHRERLRQEGFHWRWRWRRGNRERPETCKCPGAVGHFGDRAGFRAGRQGAFHSQPWEEGCVEDGYEVSPSSASPVAFAN